MEKAYVKLKGDVEKEVVFMGIFQSSVVLDPSPLIGGHSGGIVARPVAVVKLNGVLKEFNIDKVYFKTIETSDASIMNLLDDKDNIIISRCVRCNRESEGCTC